MPNRHVWYELITSDQTAAEAFYTKVVGWKITDSGLSGMNYSIIKAGEIPVGGVLTKAGGPPPIWLGYIEVDDVDAFAEKVKAAGGSIHSAPADITQVGRFAVVADPQGAVFVLFKGSSTSAPPRLPYMTPGTTGWHELHTSDAAAGFEFYAALFGWTKDQAFEMGPMGTYQLFRSDDVAVGGIMNDPGQSPMWLYVFAVEEIEVAKTRVIDAGGTLLHGPMEVPGGAWVIQARDPQGAKFALVAPPRT